MKKLTLSIAALALMLYAAAPVSACDGDKKADTKQTSATQASATTKSCGAATTTATQASSTTTTGKSCTAAEKAACAGTATTTASMASANGKSCDVSKCGASMTAANPGCCESQMAAAAAKEMNYAGQVTVVNMNVAGMTCGGCAQSISAALAGVEGVVKVLSVDHKAGFAKVVVDPTKVKNEYLAKMITDKGYKSEIIPAVATSVTGAKTGSCSAEEKAACAAKKDAAATQTSATSTPQ